MNVKVNSEGSIPNDKVKILYEFISGLNNDEQPYQVKVSSTYDLISLCNDKSTTTEQENPDDLEVIKEEGEEDDIERYLL